MWYPHHGFGWETMLFGGLMMVLFWGLYRWEDYNAVRPHSALDGVTPIAFAAVNKL